MAATGRDIPSICYLITFFKGEHPPLCKALMPQLQGAAKTDTIIEGQIAETPPLAKGLKVCICIQAIYLIFQIYDY